MGYTGWCKFILICRINNDWKVSVLSIDSFDDIVRHIYLWIIFQNIY